MDARQLCEVFEANDDEHADSRNRGSEYQAIRDYLAENLIRKPAVTQRVARRDMIAVVMARVANRRIGHTLKKPEQGFLLTRAIDGRCGNTMPKTNDTTSANWQCVYRSRYPRAREYSAASLRWSCLEGLISE